MPAVHEHLTAKCYLDQTRSNSVNKKSLLRLDLDEKLKLDEQDSIVLNSTLTSQKKIKEILTKSYNDSLSENDRDRRDLSTSFSEEDIEFDNNKLANSVNRNL